MNCLGQEQQLLIVDPDRYSVDFRFVVYFEQVKNSLRKDLMLQGFLVQKHHLQQVELHFHCHLDRQNFPVGISAEGASASTAGAPEPASLPPLFTLPLPSGGVAI